MERNELTFGVEIECLSPVGGSYRTAVDVLHSVGAPTTGEHLARWDVRSDGSLRGEYRKVAMEIVSPVLRGDEGREQLHRVVTALATAGFTINSSCGLHVHVGTGAATGKQLKHLAKLYLKYADAFESLIEGARAQNSYCKNNRRVLFRSATPEQINETFRRVISPDRVERLMNRGDRYMALNFCSHFIHRTVEFRQHHATMDATAVVEWVKLVTGFTARAFTLNGVVVKDNATTDLLLRNTDEAGRQYYRHVLTYME